MTENKLLNNVRNIENVLPADIKSALGAFSWHERLHTVLEADGKHRIHFYSDGLSLSHKTSIENILREALIDKVTNLAVYFERKEKSAAAPQKDNSASQQASIAQHQHTHKPQYHGEVPHNHKPPANPFAGRRQIPGVKKIIAVASGKGGVGKSTVSVNLALALYNQGYKVGILDADIYGPSVPTMLNIHGEPVLNENNKIIPLEAHGLKVMSFGFFAPEETAVIWRGPMIMKALQQFFWDVDWGELDFLVIDLPPGTGDAQLTLVQSIPISGAVIVTTPQNVALLDAVKGIAMFEKTEVPIVGIVENMSIFDCPACGTQSHIFGSGGADRVAEKFSVPVLGHIPLVTEIRAAGDLGEPLTTQAQHPVRISFAEIAEKVVKNIMAVKN